MWPIRKLIPDRRRIIVDGPSDVNWFLSSLAGPSTSQRKVGFVIETKANPKKKTGTMHKQIEVRLDSIWRSRKDGSGTKFGFHGHFGRDDEYRLVSGMYDFTTKRGKISFYRSRQDQQNK